MNLIKKIKQNKDYIAISAGVAVVIAGTAFITYRVTAARFDNVIFNMNLIAEEAGVLETILKYQAENNLTK